MSCVRTSPLGDSSERSAVFGVRSSFALSPPSSSARVRCHEWRRLGERARPESLQARRRRRHRARHGADRGRARRVGGAARRRRRRVRRRVDARGERRRRERERDQLSLTTTRGEMFSMLVGIDRSSVGIAALGRDLLEMEWTQRAGPKESSGDATTPWSPTGSTRAAIDSNDRRATATRNRDLSVPHVANSWNAARRPVRAESVS